MKANKSLKEWINSKPNQIWEFDSWSRFLKDFIIPLLKNASNLLLFYEFLNSEEICGKDTIMDIEDENLKEKVKVAVYGGISSKSNIEDSFAKFMYDMFGICIKGSSSFETSIELYRRFPDKLKIANQSSWISNIPIGELMNKLSDIIYIFENKLKLNLSEFGLQNYRTPIENIEPLDLLPSPGESPEKMISLILEFKQNAKKLAIGSNPFMTFCYYCKSVPLIVLKEFVACKIEDLYKILEFLDIEAYEMINNERIELSTKSPDVVMLMKINNGLIDKLLDLQEYLVDIDEVIQQAYINMTKEAIEQIDIKFEPWEDYLPIFNFIKEKEYSWYKFLITNGKLTKMITSYKINESLDGKIYLIDFLMKFYPLFIIGLIDYMPGIILQFYGKNQAREWVEKVINNNGETKI